MNASLLIVDDEKTTREGLRAALEDSSRETCLVGLLERGAEAGDLEGKGEA